MRMRSTKCKILPMDSYQFSLFTQIITFYCLCHLGTFLKKAHPLLIAGIILFYASKDLKWSKGPFFLAFMSQNGGNLRQKN